MKVVPCCAGCMNSTEEQDDELRCGSYAGGCTQAAVPVQRLSSYCSWQSGTPDGEWDSTSPVPQLCHCYCFLAVAFALLAGDTTGRRAVFFPFCRL